MTTPTHGAEYEKGWGQCTRCGCRRPEREMVDGACKELEGCYRLKFEREAAK